MLGFRTGTGKRQLARRDAGENLPTGPTGNSDSKETFKCCGRSRRTSLGFLHFGFLLNESLSCKKMNYIYVLIN
eukprot:1161745-Pelagomonas_calceolata.AAC.15